MKGPILSLLITLCVLSLFSCEKVVFDVEEDASAVEAGNVTIKASMFNIVPFDDTRAVQNIADYCTKLCFVVYQDGEQKKKILQKKGDDDYGQVSMSLAAGTYQLLVLGHSSSGNPSLAHPEKIQFTNATGYSDTFYYYADLEVSEQTETHSISLQRAASMLRINIVDEIPANAERIRVYYTGESGVFDAEAGWGGATNSKQYIFYDVASRQAPITVAAYTFLRNETGTLNVILTAYDADDNVLAEKELKDVPMKNHMVTEYTGSLFSSSLWEQDFSFSAETEWEIYEQHNF